MVITTGNVLTVAEWAQRKDRIIDGMRKQIAKKAEQRDLVLGNEVVEEVFMRHDGNSWVGVGENWDSATHVRVMVEVGAEHA